MGFGLAAFQAAQAPVPEDVPMRVLTTRRRATAAEQKDPETGMHYFGDADHFFSYNWDSPFDDVVDAICAHSCRRVAAGKSKDRFGQPMTIKLSGPVEAWFEDAGAESDDASDDGMSDDAEVVLAEVTPAKLVSGKGDNASGTVRDTI